ncbi:MULTISPECIES: L,D-transpeptidase [Gordonia]|uniref:L,D-transpeptidase n=1 Tax=Gordonia amicalis TaxID=89053 RepID=A0AAE4QZD1_9ACTN|nr:MULTISPECIES: L,D-transpeptidase [Gordonia]MCR8895683.1 L,D-transpeptidase [Gordonia sp. GONU]MCZ4577535.1 L,D-transpeptidase [Gordonia amicalis]MCZ4651164.1 L,D-transpeptidase [Gordonia amicalis]MDJ0451471.1 L,D-transpeptidase [Gordonia amicalis]MDV6305799.1 L,D-transpeptidase [Gordonia amicalis]
MRETFIEPKVRLVQTNTEPITRSRRRSTRRLTGIAVGVLAMALALPGVANAAPVTVIPGLPPVEIPVIPGLPTPPAPSAPKAPEPPSSATTPEKPADPAIPNVKTPTGYIALADDKTHTITWWKNGEVVKKMPISMGSDKHPTPNGVYHTKEKYRDMYMDSSTYGVPVDSAEGYRTYVEYATRMSWDGIFIHAAPWSVAQQGNSNVSHGCINVTTEYGKWVYDNVPRGTPIVVRNTVGGQYQGD